MKTRAAILRTQPGDWEIAEVELDVPRQGELLIKMAACGLCHSDLHLAINDQPLPTFPFAGGHEGAGVVVETGPNTVGYSPGDHVVLSFLPVCGRCRMCATGHQSLCDLGLAMFFGSRPDDPTSFRMSLDGAPVAQMAGISALSEYTVADARSVVKIDPAIPLDKAALVSCGVATGWGSVTNVADVRPGDVVIVMGVGGVGINAVQAAVAVGAEAVIAVDPVAAKLEWARKLGASHTADDMAEATRIAQALTNGQGADATVITVGRTMPQHVTEGLNSIRKAGTVVVTGLGTLDDPEGPALNNTLLTVFHKRLQGALYGGMNPTWDIPHLLAQYAAGRLELDALITRTYSLDQVNQGFQDLVDGRNLRGVVIFD